MENPIISKDLYEKCNLIIEDGNIIKNRFGINKQAKSSDYLIADIIIKNGVIVGGFLKPDKVETSSEPEGIIARIKRYFLERKLKKITKIVIKDNLELKNKFQSLMSEIDEFKVPENPIPETSPNPKILDEIIQSLDVERTQEPAPRLIYRAYSSIYKTHRGIEKKEGFRLMKRMSDTTDRAAADLELLDLEISEAEGYSVNFPETIENGKLYELITTSHPSYDREGEYDGYTEFNFQLLPKEEQK